ncbi:MAG TPA: maleylpyruvate isomerase family mycothiol-dependent enzyme [Segeticoccus sp.]|nr:maleylpyruvate isomerase family mycothiol-dependent enzyme [Segeticoccus sp.]
MPEAPLPASLTEAVALLERAIGYGRAALGGVTDELLSRPTPCREWDLATLLGHMEDSLAAMCEAAEAGEVALEPVRPDGAPAAGGAGATVGRLRDRACALLGGWVARVQPAGPGGLSGVVGPGVAAAGGCGVGARPALPMTVGGQPLAAELLVHAGALEIAVHAWDVTRSCGLDHPLPADLAARLLELAPALVVDEDRPVRFGPVRPVPPEAGPGERLLAHLGRRA